MVQILMLTVRLEITTPDFYPRLGVLVYRSQCAWPGGWIDWQRTYAQVRVPEPYSACSSDIPHPLGSVDPQESVVVPRGCGDLDG